ncbi:hypothetical protein BG011_004840 [Mortierella polycephala]|uniref:Uncharacterized protein n=1 Tax=Mortierella polycephala TaxID=41804 RepID=A0A9P6PZF8_9FUNG|nr:hypothetical protein BG011_004840 [Mortierella polycephala]
MSPAATRDEICRISKLVDMTLPRPIPAKTALRMIKNSIKILMFTRGLMNSSWNHLEMLLEQERMQEESGWSSREDALRTKSLKEFLDRGERMFTDLEESIYTQLYANFQSKPDLTTSSPAAIYISLALILGTTVTTPKEQYMIRIGPLEPQQPTPKATSPSSNPFTLIPPLSECSTLSNDSEIQSSMQQQVDSNTCDENDEHGSGTTRGMKREREEQDRQEPQPHEVRLEEQKQHREEARWERQLAQKIVGVTVVPNDQSSADQRSNSDQQQESSVAMDGYATLLGRTHVHLLMKARSGQRFAGMLPKQMIVLQEDYSINEIEDAKEKKASQSERSSTTAASMTAIASKKKKTRWPIHHLHILAPTSTYASAPASESSSMTTSPKTTLDDMANVHANEMWYQVGFGIPVLTSDL